MSSTSISMHRLVSIETTVDTFGPQDRTICRTITLRDAKGEEVEINCFADRIDDLNIRDMDILVEELEAEEIEVTA